MEDNKKKHYFSSWRNIFFCFLVVLATIFCVCLLILTLYQFNFFKIKNMDVLELPKNVGEYEAIIMLSCAWDSNSEICKNFLSQEMCSVSPECIEQCLSQDYTTNFWNYRALVVARTVQFFRDFPEYLNASINNVFMQNNVKFGEQRNQFESLPLIERLRQDSSFKELPKIPQVFLHTKFITCWKTQLYFTSQLIDTPSTLNENIYAASWYQDLICPINPDIQSCSFELINENSSENKDKIEDDKNLRVSTVENNPISFENDCISLNGDKRCSNETLIYKPCTDSVCYFTKKNTDGICGKEFNAFQNDQKSANEEKLKLTTINLFCCVQGLDKIMAEYQSGFTNTEKSSLKLSNNELNYDICDRTKYILPNWWTESNLNEEPVQIVKLIWTYSPATESEIDKLVKETQHVFGQENIETVVKLILNAFLSDALSVPASDITFAPFEYTLDNFPTEINETWEWKDYLIYPFTVQTPIVINKSRNLNSVNKDITDYLENLKKRESLGQFPELLSLLLKFFKFQD